MAATNKGSTKPVSVNWEMVRKMAAMHCSVRGVASVLNVSEDTIQKHCKKEHGMPAGEWFAIQAERGMCKVRYQLAKAQISLAVVDKNPTMLIWLGKQYLGQSDKGALEINSTVTRLCMANRPVLEKENNLRDVQIEIAEDAKIINLAQGEVARAQLNERTIVALSAAKRKVPTEEECNRDLIP